jgi:hypothetical protein
VKTGEFSIARTWCRKRNCLCFQFTVVFPSWQSWKACERTRELYANIEESETAETILRHPKSPHLQPFLRQSHPLIPGHLANSVGGPEKAGVGGSSPSLATTF